MFCPYCGNPLMDDYEFCPKCGNAIRVNSLHESDNNVATAESACDGIQKSENPHIQNPMGEHLVAIGIAAILIIIFALCYLWASSLSADMYKNSPSRVDQDSEVAQTDSNNQDNIKNTEEKETASILPEISQSLDTITSGNTREKLMQKQSEIKQMLYCITEDEYGFCGPYRTYDEMGKAYAPLINSLEEYTALLDKNQTVREEFAATDCLTDRYGNIRELTLNEEEIEEYSSTGSSIGEASALMLLAACYRQVGDFDSCLRVRHRLAALINYDELIDEHTITGYDTETYDKYGRLMKNYSSVYQIEEEGNRCITRVYRKGVLVRETEYESGRIIKEYSFWEDSGNKYNTLYSYEDDKVIERQWQPAYGDGSDDGISTSVTETPINAYGYAPRKKRIIIYNPVPK